MITLIISALLLLAIVEITGADASAVTSEDMIWAALLVIGDTLILKKQRGER